jgi:hypothetical protein
MPIDRRVQWPFLRINGLANLSRIDRLRTDPSALSETLGPVDKPRPDADASKQDESHEAGGEVVISGGDATVLLEMPNEALNP